MRKLKDRDQNAIKIRHVQYFYGDDFIEENLTY